MNEGARGSGCIAHSARNGASRGLNGLQVEFPPTEQDRELSPCDTPAPHLCSHKMNLAILPFQCTRSTSALDLYMCVCIDEIFIEITDNTQKYVSPPSKRRIAHTKVFRACRTGGTWSLIWVGKM